MRDLSVGFSDGDDWHEVLNEVSFAVKPGEVVGIVGESGCGKSLTALSILGLLPKHGARLTGQILFEGRDLTKLSERQLRDVRGRRISMVFQEPMSALDPVFPVGTQIVETVRRHFKIGKREAEERAVEALDAVGISSPRQAVKMYPSSLSGGMRQRVLIAIALVCEPRLLIADEPTTALDVTIQAQIMDLLLELGQRTGTAILFITHNLGLVAESCRRMLTMYAGQVVEDGRVRDILARPFHPYTAGLLGSIPQAARRKTLLHLDSRPRALAGRNARRLSLRAALYLCRATLPRAAAPRRESRRPPRALPPLRRIVARRSCIMSEACERPDPDRRPSRHHIRRPSPTHKGQGGRRRQLRGPPRRDLWCDRRVRFGQIDARPLLSSACCGRVREKSCIPVWTRFSSAAVSCASTAAHFRSCFRIRTRRSIRA